MIPERLKSWLDPRPDVKNGKVTMLLRFRGVLAARLDFQSESEENGGRGGIRTPDTLSGTPVFKTGAINHSATLPF